MSSSNSIYLPVDSNFNTVFQSASISYLLIPNFRFVLYCVTKILAISGKQTRESRKSNFEFLQLSSNGILTNNFSNSRSAHCRSAHYRSQDRTKTSGDNFTYGGPLSRAFGAGGAPLLYSES